LYFVSNDKIYAKEFYAADALLVLIKQSFLPALMLNEIEKPKHYAV